MNMQLQDAVQVLGNSSDNSLVAVHYWGSLSRWNRTL